MCCSSGPSAAQINLQNAQTAQTQSVTQLYNLEAGAFPQLLQQNQEQFQLDQQWMGTEQSLAEQSLGIQEQYASTQQQLANQEIAQSKQQMGIADQMFQNYKTQFGEQQSIMNGLTQVFAPIFKAGPNQYGFSKAEDAALRTQATEGTAQNFLSAENAAGTNIAAEGGGREVLPNGTNAAIQEGLTGAAAAQQSQEQLGITEAGYQQGYNEWLNAAQGLGSVAQLANPSGSGQLAMSGFQGASSSIGAASQAISGASGATSAGLGNILGAGQGVATLSNSFSTAMSALGGYAGQASNLANTAISGAQSAYNMANTNNQEKNASSFWNTMGGILGGIGGALI